MSYEEVVSIAIDTAHSPSNIGTGVALVLLDRIDARAARYY